MQRKYELPVTLAIGILVAGVILGVAVFLPSQTTPGMVGIEPSVALVNLAAVDALVADPLEGAFSGEVKVDWGLTGVLSDTLATPTPSNALNPPDLGSFDLGLLLRQSGNSVTGYVDLDHTLVFTHEHTIQATPVGPTPFPGTPAPGATPLSVGPQVQGSFDGVNLVLRSGLLDETVAGKPIQRQFSLTGKVERTENLITYRGEYRETVWKYMPQPVTIIGSFAFYQAIFGSAPDNPNRAPIAVADTATTAQGVAVTLNVVSNDSDANGDTLTVSAVSAPAHGTATTDGQNITYKPNAGFVGVESFTYTVADGKGGSASGVVTVTVTDTGGGNHPPTAANDSATTTPGSAVTIAVKANDSDPDGDALTVTITSQPSHGTATANNGQIVYTPSAGFVGGDSFTYTVADGKGGSASATVTVTVTGAGGSNHPPTAANDSATTTQGVAVTINVKTNDSDPDGDALTVSVTGQPSHGTATANNGQIVYTPSAGFVGGDSFTYTVVDGKGGAASATVSVTVTGTGGGNQPPTAGNDSATTTPGSAVTINVKANDADPDGDALTVSITGQPSHGAATVNNGQIVYTPNAGFVGVDSFTYTVVDGKGGAASATVSVTVTDSAAPTQKVYLPLVNR